MAGFVNSFAYTKEICSEGWGGGFDVRIKGCVGSAGFFLIFSIKFL